jgi:RecA-family ATPase
MTHPYPHAFDEVVDPPDVPPDLCKLIALPYGWRDPKKIPRRQLLFGRHYIRKTIGATIGGGGRGKTTLGLLEFVGMACGRNLLTGEEITPLRVWCLNGEEDQDELDRRVAAICQRYEIDAAKCGGRLFVQSVRDKPIRFATLIKNVAVLDCNLLDQFEAEITAKRIDVFGLDPLISFHSVAESTNEHMDLLLKEGLGGIASRTDSAGEVFHHPGKPKPGQVENTVEDARGASAIIWAVRSARVLNFMTPEDAKRLGIGEDDRRLHPRQQRQGQYGAARQGFLVQAGG